MESVNELSANSVNGNFVEKRLHANDSLTHNWSSIQV